jgi:hypothetical protein
METPHTRSAKYVAPSRVSMTSRRIASSARAWRFGRIKATCARDQSSTRSPTGCRSRS